MVQWFDKTVRHTSTHSALAHVPEFDLTSPAVSRIHYCAPPRSTPIMSVDDPGDQQLSRKLLSNIAVLWTGEDEDPIQCASSIYIEGGVIAWIGAQQDLPADLAAKKHDVIDMSKTLVTPGFVNTHHHMYQSLTKCLARDSELFEWLTTLFPIWENLTPDMVYKSARFAIAELLLSGCTLTTDMLYLYPNGVKLDDTIRAAQELGIRFQPCRGATSRGRSKGGLPPDSLVEDETEILKDMERVLDAYHDSSFGAMVRIALAPCSPFTVSEQLMRNAAELARSPKYSNVMLHTHLAENSNDIAFMERTVQKSLIEFLETNDWARSDCWFAHCVHLDPRDSVDTPTIDYFAQKGLGVAHCPVSNCRLASGIAPVRRMLDLGVKVGLGVDGSASNDSGNLLSEARMALMVARARGEDPKALSTTETLRLATSSGAAVLGRSDVGRIRVGMCADLVSWRLDQAAFSGACHDSASVVGALILGHGGNMKANMVMVNGKIVVEGGQLAGPHNDMENIVREHNEAVIELQQRARRSM